ncbi:MAG: protein kinase [Alphaproteobacteria bacterium]|nr:protein kinase [Alphaproteobacteria bacterium]
MALTWRAVLPGAEAALAVKVLRPDAPGGAAQALGEARAVAALSHPNVVAVHDLGVVEPQEAEASGGRLSAGAPWLAMELLPGGTLLERRCADWGQARGWLAELLSALAHAHARGVVHRDLKPENVLFDAEGRLRVVDFGFALQVERAGQERPAVGGTPSAMAPEQFSTDWRRQGPWTDLYALGVLAWELVTGAPPLKAETLGEWVRAHRLEEPGDFTPRFPVPAETEAWLRRLLAKAPARRPRSAAEALAGLPGQAPSGQELPAPWRAPLSSAPRETLWSEASWIAEDIEAIEVSENSPPARSPAPGLLPERWQRPAWIRQAPRAAGLVGLREPPLAGREREQDRLWARLREVAEQGAPRLVLLRGPAGVGKTALARWQLHRAAELDCAACFSAWHGSGAAGSQGLRGLLERSLRASGLAGVDLRLRLEQARRDGETDERLEDLEAALTQAAAGDLRLALTRRLLTRSAAGRPALLLLDELQWGAGARALVESLLDGAQPVLVLGTLGEAPVTGAAAEELAALRADDRCEVLDLEPLSRGAMERLLLSFVPLDAGLAARVVRTCAGNPRFAVELMRRWTKAGALQPGPRGFVLADPDAPDALPLALSSLGLSRVRALLRGDPQATFAVELAAALGERVYLQEWRQACADAELPPPDALLARLVAADLARPEPGVAWRWSHELLRQAVLEAAGEERPALHAACAEVVSAEHSEGRRRLAHHLLQAGRLVEAVPMLLGLCNELFYEGDRGAVQAACDAAEGALRELGCGDDDPRYAQLLSFRARALRLGHDAEGALALARAAEARAGADASERSRARIVQAQCLIDLHRHDEVLAISGENPLLKGFQAMALAQSGRLDEAEEAVARLTGTQFIAVFLRGMIALERGQHAEAERALREAIETAEQAASPLNAASFRVSLGGCLREAGRVDEARALLLDAASAFERLGSPWIREARHELAMLEALHGDAQQARAAAARVLQERETPSRLEQNTLARGALALAGARLGDLKLVDQALAAPPPEIPFTRAQRRDLRRLWASAAAELPPGGRAQACLARMRVLAGAEQG